MAAEVWFYPLIGGIIIGIASSLMLAFNGRIAGISGILGGALAKPSGQFFWRYSFLLGLSLGGILVYFAEPEFFNYKVKLGWFEAVVGGLLVGYGTQMGSGCTSGHGVCGLPRLSIRSIVATVLNVRSCY